MSSIYIVLLILFCRVFFAIFKEEKKSPYFCLDSTAAMDLKVGVKCHIAELA